ncbi:TPA: ATP-dependent Clp protease proteolytic subunit [Klebsiella variicola]
MDVCLKAISSPNQPASEIRIYISSKGGDTVAGFTAYNFLKSLPVKVKMTCSPLINTPRC